MNLDAFADLPDDARVWIYAFETELDPDREQLIRQGLEPFMHQWVSHEASVQGAFEIFWHRFTVVAAHCPQGISGCSIDSLVRNFKGFSSLHGVDGLKGGILYFRNQQGEVQAVEQLNFRDLIESGTVSAETPVFQTSLQTLGRLRTGEFEAPVEILHAIEPRRIRDRQMADFLVLDANPLDDITNTRRISAVYIRGEEVNRDALSARLLGGTP